ncbi:hypothetical protein MZTS_22095 [Methylorubrum zatmanii]|nr:hypothetical protein [Methylorubrum zatmanii]
MRRVYLGTLASFALLVTASAAAQSFVDSDLDSGSGMPRDKARSRRSNLGEARPTDAYAIPQVMHRSGDFDLAGPRHTGGRRAGRTSGDSILDRGICIGC